MRDLTAFNHRLATTFGSLYKAGYDVVVRRYFVDTPTADGKIVRQFWGWFHDQGRPLAPDEITGLHAYRDLDESAQEEVIRNLHKSYIGKTGNGLADWNAHMQARRDHNAALTKRNRKARAQTYADLIADIAGTTVKYHEGSATARRIARSA